ATRSAMAASLDKIFTTTRGHIIPPTYPFLISSDIQTITKTQDVLDILKLSGLEAELMRAAKRTIRAGRGKTRGRPYKQAVGPLLVVSDPCPVIQAVGNIPGMNVITINKLNAHILAPGGHPGRLTLYTEAAIDKLNKERLFI
ncbi:MAG: 50S ribosomal protein L4, partial [Nanoarchaeota archaeon]